MQWQRHLREHVWQYNHLRPEQRQRLEQVVSGMVHDRHWTGGNNFQITDQMRVVVSGQAALMTLGLDEPYYFDRIPEIILYPKPFFVTNEQATEWSTDPIFGFQTNQPRLGEAWHRGPIVLAWESIVEPFDGEGFHTNVVLHEFTHHLDGLDGDVSGAPPMTDLEQERDWYRVTEADYFQLVGRASREEATLLNHYGATNRAEFFAVAAECFFDRPHDLREEHPHLYEVLATYFRQSPVDFLPRSSQPRHRKETDEGQTKATLRPQVANDPFTRGLTQHQEGDYASAIESFSQAIAHDPDDGEAYAERAYAYLASDEPNKALADAEAALALDPNDNDALTLRGCALALLGDHQAAIRILRKAADTSDSAEARAYLGYAYLQLGRAKEAVHQLSLAIAIDPYDAQLYLWRADAHDARGHSDRADADRRKAEHLEPGDR